MIEALIIIVGGSITAITCGSLWFVSVIDKRERQLEDDLEGGEERVFPYPSGGATSDCALCGQKRFYLRVKATKNGRTLRWNCSVCNGSYRTKINP
jgi:hypothetical protein